MQNFAHVVSLVLLGFAVSGLIKTIVDLKFYGRATGDDISDKHSKV